MSILLLPWAQTRPWWNKGQGSTANSDIATSNVTARNAIADSGYFYVQNPVGWQFGPIQDSEDPSRHQGRGQYNQPVIPPVVDLRALITQTGPGRVRQDSAAQRPPDLGLKTPYYF